MSLIASPVAVWVVAFYLGGGGRPGEGPEGDEGEKIQEEETTAPRLQVCPRVGARPWDSSELRVRALGVCQSGATVW